MESNYNPYSYGVKIKETLPNSTAVLTLGILSIVFCWCCYLPSLVMAIIAIVLGAQGRSAYRANPEKYTQASFSNLNAGYICAIVGIVLTAVLLVFSIVNAIVNPSSSSKYQQLFESL